MTIAPTDVHAIQENEKIQLVYPDRKLVVHGTHKSGPISWKLPPMSYPPVILLCHSPFSFGVVPEGFALFETDMQVSVDGHRVYTSTALFDEFRGTGYVCFQLVSSEGGTSLELQDTSASKEHLLELVVTTENKYAAISYLIWYP